MLQPYSIGWFVYQRATVRDVEVVDGRVRVGVRAQRRGLRCPGTRGLVRAVDVARPGSGFTADFEDLADLFVVAVDARPV